MDNQTRAQVIALILNTKRNNNSFWSWSIFRRLLQFSRNFVRIQQCMGSSISRSRNVIGLRGTKFKPFQIKLKILIFWSLTKNSSIIGFNFRLWWIIAFILSAALGTYAVWNIWMKWDGRPVIVSFDDKSTSISTIPFPAVTACTTRKFVEDKIDTELFSNILMEMERNKTFYLGHKPET